jgi:TRAP-type C4-dicarboxylate transport system substrate-binding protein
LGNLSGWNVGISLDGFNAVAMPESEIMKQLKTLNGIEAVPIPAYPAQLLGLYRDAPYMLQFQVAQLVGAVIVTTNSWNKIQESDRKVLSDAAKAMQTRLEKEVPKKDAVSIAEMRKEGRDLKVTMFDAKAAAEFRAEAAKDDGGDERKHSAKGRFRSGGSRA